MKPGAALCHADGAMGGRSPPKEFRGHLAGGNLQRVKPTNQHRDSLFLTTVEMGKSRIFAACAGRTLKFRPVAGLRPAGSLKTWPAAGRRPADDNYGVHTLVNFQACVFLSAFGPIFTRPITTSYRNTHEITQKR